MRENPTRELERYRGRPKDRILSPTELAKLGATLRAHAETQLLAVVAIRAIALCGARRTEILSLSWDRVNPDDSFLCVISKTDPGGQIRAVGTPVFDALDALPRPRDDNATVFVFESTRLPGNPADLKKKITDLFNAAELKDARAHDLRRTFASVAADLGFSDSTIGELLGHARRGVTRKHYIRRPDAALVTAAEAVSSRMAAMLDTPIHQKKE